MSGQSAIPGSGLPGSGTAQERFRELLHHWDTTPRQGLPQIAGGLAVFLWRGQGDEFPALHAAPVSALRRAWDIRNGGASEPSPGRPLPSPRNVMVQGFALSPRGDRVAALFSDPGSELAEVWLLAPDTPPGLLPGAHSWHAEPVWTGPGAGPGVGPGVGHGLNLWVLDGRPGDQRIVGWTLDGETPDAEIPKTSPHILPFPEGLHGETAGLRLVLSSERGTLLLRSRTPGTPGQSWVHDGTSWTLLADARSKNPETGGASTDNAPSGREAALLNTLAGTVRAVEYDDATSVELNGGPLLRLGASEQLRELSVSADSADDGPPGDQPGGTLWIRTASPGRPSAVACLPLADPPETALRTPEESGVAHLRLLAPSDDGAAIPLLLSVRKAGLTHEGRPRRPAPLLLSCYGGFGVRHRIEPEPSVPAWLESGGVYVAAQVRGGGELGPAWHEAGRGRHKERTVRDLLAVARFLVAAGWTTPARTVAVGASHGGFVVTAATLLQPSAFGGVIAVAPLLDTVDLERHGLGRQWLHEFGADGECSPGLRAATSPLHLLRRSSRLDRSPALLCCVMGRDERVDNDAAQEFTELYRSRGGQAWLYREETGGHAQRQASDVLDFSATVLAFAEAVAGREHDASTLSASGLGDVPPPPRGSS
ncbi:prolyl oligopeptidase family serine peptidase [Arthrobacter sp. NPDC090010]|uniref:prolyl oligopeptidase family serine peptidase n=1 Tax=Arthrobacter sp. NPDC090010 TaxID=3363942 RepID=UPI003822FAC1